MIIYSCNICFYLKKTEEYKFETIELTHKIREVIGHRSACKPLFFCSFISAAAAEITKNLKSKDDIYKSMATIFL